VRAGCLIELISLGTILPLDTAIRQMTSQEPLRACPTSPDAADPSVPCCKGQARVLRWCLSPPPVFAVSLVWPSSHVSRRDLLLLLSSLCRRIDLSRCFRLGTRSPEKLFQLSPQCTPPPLYDLCGMICYRGQHYISIIRHGPAFLLFDDHHVDELGQWEDVRILCEKRRYQPTLLFYEEVRFRTVCRIPVVLSWEKR
jgi:hypothetical protein